jgi:hypothetical protein
MWLRGGEIFLGIWVKGVALHPGVVKGSGAISAKKSKERP